MAYVTRGRRRGPGSQQQFGDFIPDTDDRSYRDDNQSRRSDDRYNNQSNRGEKFNNQSNRGDERYNNQTNRDDRYNSQSNRGDRYNQSRGGRGRGFGGRGSAPRRVNHEAKTPSIGDKEEFPRLPSKTDESRASSEPLSPPRAKQWTNSNYRNNSAANQHKERDVRSLSPPTEGGQKSYPRERRGNRTAIRGRGGSERGQGERTDRGRGGLERPLTEQIDKLLIGQRVEIPASEDTGG